MIHFYLLNPRMCQLGVRNVGLNFLFLKSIQMPVGVVLALGFSTGAIGGAVLLPLWSISEEPAVSRRPQFRDDRVNPDRTEPLEEI
ncbi:hypothetical protein [Microcoleus sp. F4-D5]|jgi:hypothetical protein|uniref:hypothetical protein n=1 Tax=Microcoleus sp. F4-D5 TaxID=2818760 RepID=UPI002FD47F79